VVRNNQNVIFVYVKVITIRCPKCKGLFKSLYWREGADGEFVKVGYMCKECKYCKLQKDKLKEARK